MASMNPSWGNAAGLVEPARSIFGGGFVEHVKGFWYWYVIGVLAVVILVMIAYISGYIGNKTSGARARPRRRLRRRGAVRGYMPDPGIPAPILNEDGRGYKRGGYGPRTSGMQTLRSADSLLRSAISQRN